MSNFNSEVSGFWLKVKNLRAKLTYEIIEGNLHTRLAQFVESFSDPVTGKPSKRVTALALYSLDGDGPQGSTVEGGVSLVEFNLGCEKLCSPCFRLASQSEMDAMYARGKQNALEAARDDAKQKR